MLVIIVISSFRNSWTSGTLLCVSVVISGMGMSSFPLVGGIIAIDPILDMEEQCLM